MIKTKLAIASILLMLAPIANVSAKTAVDDFDSTVIVPTMCELITGPWDISMVHDSTGGNTAGFGNSNILMVCSEDLPFTLEVDAGPGGSITLTDAATSKTVGASLTITEIDERNPVVWGQAVNGEGYSRVSDGLATNYPIYVSYDSGLQPSTGIYSYTANLTLNF